MNIDEQLEQFAAQQRFLAGEIAALERTQWYLPPLHVHKRRLELLGRWQHTRREFSRWCAARGMTQ